MVVWLSSTWLFGKVPLGDLEQIHSAICDLQIVVCCLYCPLNPKFYVNKMGQKSLDLWSGVPNLRKQCVNILFQLGVFSDIHRKSHFCKALIISTLTQQQNITEYHFKILIIWRSLVQAQAGPLKKISNSEDNRVVDFFIL